MYFSLFSPASIWMDGSRWRPWLGCSPAAAWYYRGRGGCCCRPTHTGGPLAGQTRPGRSKVSCSSQLRTETSPGGGSPWFPRNISVTCEHWRICHRRKRRQQPSGLLPSGKPPSHRLCQRTGENCLSPHWREFCCSYSETRGKFPDSAQVPGWKVTVEYSQAQLLNTEILLSINQHLI